MEKAKTKIASGKRTSFYNKSTEYICPNEKIAEIRLGINSADEVAKNELRKRKLEAPLSIEEKILKAGK